MRILSTLTFYHPHWTGLSVVARRLAEGMASRGHGVTVLTSRHDRALPRRDALRGVAIVRVPIMAKISRTVVMPSFPFELAREVARSDIVHLHTPMPEAPIVAAIARGLRKPVLVTHHGDVVMPSWGAFNRVVQVVMDKFLLAGMRWSDRIVVHVGDYRDRSVFLRPVASKVDAIYPPVELPSPQPAEVERLRDSFALDGRPVVGFAGRFVEEKGFDFLLRAIPAVREALPDVLFLFAGETAIGYEDFFERNRGLFEGQRDVIVELGLVRDPAAMANFYASCDVFVVPSRTDCFAIVQVESLLCGTPLVTSDIPGAREVIRVTGAGALVRPQDPAAIAEGIIRVLGRPERYRAAAATVRRIFDPERSIDRYETLMERLIERRRPSRATR